MLNVLMKRMKCISNIFTLIVFIFVFTSCLFAETTTEKNTRMMINSFKMHLVFELKEDVLQKIISDDRNQIVELGNWKNKPMQVESSITNGDIRIRFEKDFIVILYHSRYSLVAGKSNPLDVIRDTVNNLLSEPFWIGKDDTLVSLGTPADSKVELQMISWPKESAKSQIITCSYRNLYRGKRDWKGLIDQVSVLIKDKDAVIVMEISKARRVGLNTYIPPYVYEGLNAAKIRLSKEEAEIAKNRPVLGYNVILSEETDSSDIPDDLLNGCIWPYDNKSLVGTRDVGLANLLRRSPTVAEVKAEQEKNGEEF
ncbi:MAG: hypothetical protein JXA96_03250 [Sedimentisphaerales bacterium]|nr:hypothetical protein [Sedimentisphaerales bacterium]